MPFETVKGTRTAYVSIEDVNSSECPVSRLTRNSGDTSRDLVQIFTQTESARDLEPLGPAKNWPGYFFDAYQVLSREKSRHDHAQQIAAHKAL